MRKIVLASHGRLSEGMYDTVQMIAGADVVKDVMVYGLMPGENANDFVQGVKKEIESNIECEYVIITDLFGGSVHTAFTGILTTPNVTLFSGMNANLVLEILLQPAQIFTKRDELIQSAKEGITFLGQDSIEPKEDDNEF